MKKTLFIISMILVFLAGVYAGYALFFKDTAEKVEISRDILLTSLKNEGFLVSQVALLQEEITVENSTGSTFKDFFWGQDIIARANIKVSSGVDLSLLVEDDISIDEHTISVSLPPITIHAVELVGEVAVENNQGILKKMFDNDDGYNVALLQLQHGARNSVKKEEFRHIAEKSAVETIERFLKFIEQEKEINITVR
ncbi:MAG: DUF4230 domain-containing protein [Candidatus Magasanikbacteria bacterium]|jgi:hypothetical protein|nr:DUF4230 domain-containing protein [Candidatus Magasanikbacteria bacterium]MBT4071578.1 DUF4230 domain-containing protein [Candidatus Magasanikbacteria bacterium]